MATRCQSVPLPPSSGASCRCPMSRCRCPWPSRGFLPPTRSRNARPHRRSRYRTSLPASRRKCGAWRSATGRSSCPQTKADSEAPLAASCDLEVVATEILLRDPNEAFGELEGAMAEVLDGEDRFEPDRLIDLAETYLAAGFGAEAVQIADQADRFAPHLPPLAAALDDLPRPDGTELDPGLRSRHDARHPSGYRSGEGLGTRATASGLSSSSIVCPSTRWRDLTATSRRTARPGRRGRPADRPPRGTRRRPTCGRGGRRHCGRDRRGRDHGGADDPVACATRRVWRARTFTSSTRWRCAARCPPGPEKAQFDLTLATAFALSRRPVETVGFVADGIVPADPFSTVAGRPSGTSRGRRVPGPSAPYAARRNGGRTPVCNRSSRSIGLPDAAARFAGRATPDRAAGSHRRAGHRSVARARPRAGGGGGGRGDPRRGCRRHRRAATPRRCRETDLAAADRVLRDSRASGGAARRSARWGARLVTAVNHPRLEESHPRSRRESRIHEIDLPAHRDDGRSP